MTPAGWVIGWGVAYSLLHHLGAVPGGLGSAGAGTQWADWVDLTLPYLVVGPALAALAAVRADRPSWRIALTGAVAYASGHGIHLSANSISNARGDAAPVQLWDEVVGHGIWYAGVALLVVALARAVPLNRVVPAGWLLAACVGATWATNAHGADGLALPMLVVALGLAGWGYRIRAAAAGRLLLVSFGVGAVLLVALTLA